MRTSESEYYVIGDLDGYWTIKQNNSSDYYVTKFLSSGSIVQYKFNNTQEVEDHILHHFYKNILDLD